MKKVTGLNMNNYDTWYATYFCSFGPYATYCQRLVCIGAPCPRLHTRELSLFLANGKNSTLSILGYVPSLSCPASSRDLPRYAQVSVPLWPENCGNRLQTSDHVVRPSTMFLTASTISVSDARTCFVLSRSRKVIVPSFTESKSTVIPSGVPSSSFRAYLFPMLADESSMRFETPILLKRCDNFRTSGPKSGCVESGTIKTLVGATAGGRDNTCELSAN